MALSKPCDPYAIVAELLHLDPIDNRPPLTQEDFRELLGEFERGQGRAAFLRREMERISDDAGG